MAAAKRKTRKPAQRGLTRAQVRGMVVSSSKTKTVRRRRRRTMADGITSQLKPVVMAAAGGVAAGFVKSKLTLSPVPKINAMIHVGIGLAVGAFAASKGQAAIGFGFAGAAIAANLGTIVPGLADGTLADYGLMDAGTMSDHVTLMEGGKYLYKGIAYNNDGTTAPQYAQPRY